MDICTIIAKNYVAQARVLARSFAEHHPGGRCHVLVIDDFDGYLDPAEEPFELVTPQAIGCEHYEEMAYRYTVIELSTAVKPWLLRHLLEAGRPAISYLDPDIRVYGSLQRLEDLAVQHRLVLTPHNTVPIPADGERPTQIDILIAGVYNLGFVSMAPGSETDGLLDWWCERLVRDCRVDPVYGYFVDQRWFDLAPGLVSDFAVMRDPEFNIAYWNAHSRRLEHDGERYTVDGRPLAFFHFSGFDPEEPHLLSRHQTRVRASENPALLRIMREYAQETMAAGYPEASRWPYTWETLPNGLRFDRRLRSLYDYASERGELRSSPFTPEGCRDLMRWLAEQAEGAPEGVNRLMANLYGTREDVREAFPDLDGPDLERFFMWLRTDAHREFPVLAYLPGYEELVPSTRDLLTAPPPPPPEAPQAPSAPWGVNVVGYFRSELGTGEAARQVVSALDAAGVPLLPLHGRTIPPNRQGHAFAHLDAADARFPVNLICMNADMLGGFAEQAGRAFFRDRYSIGLWFWEVERLPSRWTAAFRHLDEVWLPTAHVAQAVAPVSPVPAIQVRVPVELPPVPERTRAQLGLPEGFVFLYSFDYHSVFERKNPLGAIEAFARAFGPGEGPQLVIKCINAESDVANHERVLIVAAERPDVHVREGYVSPEDKNALAASADCYLSLHRSEGFGLTMAEAMYMGRPVIATAYSGNLDFMTRENSYLVDYRLVRIGEQAPPYPADAQWADPDLDHAARLMRSVFEHPEQAAARGARAAADLRRTHSAAAAGAVMAERLDQVRASRALADGRSLDLTAPLAGRVREGPATAGTGGPLRRALLRLLRPVTTYQQGVDTEIARCVQLLDWRLQSAEHDAAQRHAALLTELRRQARLADADAQPAPAPIGRAQENGGTRPAPAGPVADAAERAHEDPAEADLGLAAEAGVAAKREA